MALVSVLNPQFLESPGEPIKRAYIPSKNSFRSIYFETLRRAKKRDVKTLKISLREEKRNSDTFDN